MKDTMKTFTVIVETPRGSVQKYDHDKKLKGFRLGKILPAGMIFPYDFGFIPGTRGADGDPLDVIILSEFNSFPGCIIECRIIGAIKAEQQSGNSMIRNDRYLAVPQLSLVYGDVNDISQLPVKLIKELEDFFKNYNRIQNKKFIAIGRVGSGKAKKMIHK